MAKKVAEPKFTRTELSTYKSLTNIAAAAKRNFDEMVCYMPKIGNAESEPNLTTMVYNYYFSELKDDSKALEATTLYFKDLWERN